MAPQAEELRLRIERFFKMSGFRLAYLSYIGKWAFLGFIVGVVGGVAAIIFQAMLILLETFFWEKFALLTGEKLATLLLPAFGGLVSGVIVYKVAPEAEGHGTDAVIRAIHRRWSKIRARVPLVKVIASSAVIASGGSAGKEGPIAQVAAGAASILGEKLGLRVCDRRVFVAAGIAAGIGAIFKAPFGASLFAIEVLYKRDYEVEAFVPSIIASVVGYSIYCSVYGWTPVLSFPGNIFIPPIEFIFVAILGLLSGFLAVIYVKIFYGMRDYVFNRIKVSPCIRPMIGGLLVGLIGLYIPHVMGAKYNVLNMIINGAYTSTIFLFSLMIFKLLATCFTVSSGGSGGIFMPSLFIGASFGALMGILFHMLLPGTVKFPIVYALIGMAALFAGAGKVPLTSIVMVTELTGGYSLLVPTTLASAISYVVSGPMTIYEAQIIERER